MGARGRQSKAELAVIVKPEFRRPPPPEGMPEDEAAIWRRTVAGESPDFFTGAVAKDNLALYCSSMAEADRLTKTIREFETKWLKSGDGIKRYALLTRQRDLHVNAAIKCARTLRLTNQSRYRAEQAATKAKKHHKMPWEFDGEDEDED